MKNKWQTFGMIAALALIWIFFSFSTEGTFLTPRNLSLLARQMSVTAILATGMVLVIVCGQIDLSVGAMAGLCGAGAALLAANFGLPVPVAFAAALALGALLGFGQGMLVSMLGIPAFIVTLGGMLLYQGCLLGMTRGVSIIPPEQFLLVGQAYVEPRAVWVLAAVWFVGCMAALGATRRWKWLLLGAGGA